MKYKEFKKWCNMRATEGTWGMKQAIYCIDTMKYINAYPFWKREKIWKEEYEHLINMMVINPINEKLGVDTSVKD